MIDDPTYRWFVERPDRAPVEVVTQHAYVSAPGALILGNLNDEDSCDQPFAIFARDEWVRVMRSAEAVVILEVEQ